MDSNRLTALGIDNTGDYVFSYGKEDTDYYVDEDPSSDYVFRVADSVFFCRLRDLFPSEMQAMFKDREEKNAWNSTSLIDQWDNSQAQFPEELWRLDYERKYYRTYLGLSIDNSISQGVDKTFLIGKFFGRKKYARRAFEINQEIYFATKYFGNKALEDVFWIRGNVPIGSNIKPNYSLTLVPYSNMYVCVQYTSTGTPIHKKVKAGEVVHFENDAERMDFVYVYAASYIQEVGDLSRCYVGDNNFSNATRLQKLVIGSTDEGYENTFMKEVLVANNPLLEHLDLRNISGINTVINVSSCGNLKELYAEGTNATGVIFANGGLLETAHLPKVASLSMKNLNYIKDFTVDSYDNLETLIVENVPNVNTYDIVTNSSKLKLLRLIGLDWDFVPQIEDGSIFNRLMTVGGIDSSGYEADLSVLTGIASVVTIGQYELYDYQNLWPDLTILVEPDNIIKQFKVTFVNYDGTVLDDVQYVQQFHAAIDPLTRDENPIAIPTKESTVQYDYAFVGWDKSLENIVEDRIITAIYDESLRTYTIKYMSKGVPVKVKSGLYGSNIIYDGDIPKYTAAEPTVFNLFNRWDKSGFLDGDFNDNGEKVVNAIFDTFSYTGGVFDGRELKDLSPVEIYALSKLTEPVDREISDFGLNVETGDDYTFTMGYDVDYDDVESVEIVSEKTVYDGTNYTDTGVKLFDVDKDFVLAIDYKMLSGNTAGATLIQCFQTSGTNGFKFSYETSPQLSWGGSAISPSDIDAREMLVIRHKKGDNNLYVYASNLSSSNISKYTIEKTSATRSENATLIFGASKQDSGRIVNYCKGEINWCKIWYKDLGEAVCEQLVGWTHEDITLEVSGFYRYQLYNDYTKESMMSLLATHLLDTTRKWNASSSNSGGWANSQLREFLNGRFYNAIPHQVRSLIKNVSVASVAGNNSSEITSSGCYVTVPSLYDVNNNPENSVYRSEVYDANGTINFMSGETSYDSVTERTNRQRTFTDGNANAYWLRSPAIGTWSTGYVWRVDETGTTQPVTHPSSTYGVLIEISL